MIDDLSNDSNDGYVCPPPIRSIKIVGDIVPNEPMSETEELALKIYGDALKEANERLKAERESFLLLCDEDKKHFLENLMNPLEPNQKLKDAFISYAKTTLDNR
jgi:uncharacterized protein (DUF1778 family)